MDKERHDIILAAQRTNYSIGSVPSLDEHVKAWMTDGYVHNGVERDAVNGFVNRLKGIGSTNETNVWDDLYWINIASATSLGASIIDLKGEYDLVAYNSPIWTNTGIQGNGSNMYLLSDYIASTHGSSLNSNSFGIAVRTAQTSTMSLMGVRTGVGNVDPYNVIHYYSGARYYGNNSTFGNTTTSQWPTGVIINNRTNSADFQVWIDNVEVYDTSETVNNLATHGMALLAQNAVGLTASHSNAEFTVAFEGKGLSDEQIEDLTESINWLNANIIIGGR